MLTIWDMETKNYYQYREHVNDVLSVSFSTDGLTLASGDSSGIVKLWDLKGGTCLHTFIGHHGNVEGVCFNPDSSMLATAGGLKIKFWEVESGREILSVKAHEDDILCLDFAKDGSKLVSGSWDKTVRIWEVCHPERERKTLLMVLKSCKHELYANVDVARRIFTYINPNLPS